MIRYFKSRSHYDQAFITWDSPAERLEALHRLKDHGWAFDGERRRFKVRAVARHLERYPGEIPWVTLSMRSALNGPRFAVDEADEITEASLYGGGSVSAPAADASAA